MDTLQERQRGGGKKKEREQGSGRGTRAIDGRGIDLAGSTRERPIDNLCLVQSAALNVSL